MNENIVPPAKIRNTSDPREVELDGLLMLANAMSGGKAEDLIYVQEKAGQRQLVESDRLPTDTYANDGAFEALGFTFGEPDPSDPLFRPATLPAGWKRQATDHDMWSKVVDQYGRERIAVFYKAAFYDRRAFMRLETPESYLRRVVYDGADPVLDDEWLTRNIAVQVLDALEREELKYAAQAAERGLRPDADADYWSEAADENFATAARYVATRDHIQASAK